MIANAINELTPTPWRDGFAAFVKADDGRHRFGLGGPQASMPEYALRYHIVYWLTFLSWAAALGLLAYTATHMTSPVSAVVGIATFGLLFPLLQTRGGYFYDYPEMFFFAAAVAIASSSRPYLLILLAPIATLNKETFLVFAPALFPFLAINGRNRAGLILGATLLASGLAYLWIRFTTASLPGEVAQFWLFQQPWFYLNPMNLFRGDATYGIPHPEISYLVFFIPVWLLVRSGWGRLTPAFQQHALIALAINLPLFIVFCYPGEIRNLSLMWVTLAMLIAIAADTAIRTRSISGVG
jgi:hypothetical protein